MNMTFRTTSGLSDTIVSFPDLREENLKSAVSVAQQREEALDKKAADLEALERRVEGDEERLAADRKGFRGERRELEVGLLAWP